VWSVEGQGSTFTLTLPRKPGPSSRGSETPAEHANVAPEAGARLTSPVRDIRMSGDHPTKELNTP
jgi:hypothetical protein